MPQDAQAQNTHLKAQLAELRAKNGAWETLSSEKTAKVADLQQQVEDLQARNAALEASLSDENEAKRLGESDSSLSIPTNAAKCSTSNDDQSKVKGTMDCGTIGDEW